MISQSARMLVQMAVDSGWAPIAIDCFADTDTCELALDTVQVASLALVDLRSSVEAVVRKYNIRFVVYGSGFEQHPDSLEFLERNLITLANPVDLFIRFQDKVAFFTQLTVLSINRPESVFSRPDKSDGWLQKPLRGEGGIGITIFSSSAYSDCGFYWQRLIEGQPCSVLFIASSGQATILGFNQQWTAFLDDSKQFIFSGICNKARITKQQQCQLQDWVQKIVDIYPLRGVCGLDFIVQDGQCYVLEINARIPASAQLYGKRVFDFHIQACLGNFNHSRHSRLRVRPRGYQVVYASSDVMVSTEIVWPDWVVDRPVPGVIIGKGLPICSIIAGGKSARQVQMRLAERQKYLENILNSGS